MSVPFQDYLKLLREVGRLLEQLAGLAQQKADVVQIGRASCRERVWTWV